MYFLREAGILGALGGKTVAAEVKVDGKIVGSVINGSYLFVDRPPGLYKLSVGTGLSVAFETEAQVEAGRAYYFGIEGQRMAPGQDLVNQAFTGGGSGERMHATSPLMAGFAGTVLSSIDPSTGAAEIERLKAP